MDWENSNLDLTNLQDNHKADFFHRSSTAYGSELVEGGSYFDVDQKSEFLTTYNFNGRQRAEIADSSTEEKQYDDITG